MKALNIHRLYETAFGGLRDKARALRRVIKDIVKAEGYSGKVLRRGTPGAFRRFARRHPQHFNKVEVEA